MYAPEIEALYDLIAAQLNDNAAGEITPARARHVLGELLAYVANLNTNQVKGALFRVPFIALVDGLPTVPTVLIPLRSRILGMEAIALNGTDASTAAAGVRADPITFQLIAHSQGTVDALVDEQATTTTTIKARWVRTSGTDEEKMVTFPVLPLEDVNVYAGEVYQHTFTNQVPAVTRLLEIRHDITSFSHPVPTGLDDDPNYKPFAPLKASSGYDDTAVRAQLVDHEDRIHTTESGLVDLENEVANLTTDEISEASTNLYFTPLRTFQALAAGGGVTVLAGGITTAGTNADQLVSSAPGGSIVTLYGYHASVNCTRGDITLRTASGGEIRNLTIGYGIYGPLDLTLDVDVSRRLVIGSSFSGDLITVRGAVRLGSTGYLESYTYYAPLYSHTVVDLLVTSTRNALAYIASGNAQQGAGLLRFQERNDGGYSTWTLRGQTRLESANNPVITGYLDSRSRVTLAPGADLLPGAGQPLTELRRLNGGPVAQDTFLIDNRSTGPSTGGATVQQIRSDSANRALTLRPAEPLMLNAITASAANNASSATFQVNKYNGTAWVGGTPRTTVADVQADIAALLPADYAQGVEVLINTVALDGTAIAYLLIDLTYGS